MWFASTAPHFCHLELGVDSLEYISWITDVMYCMLLNVSLLSIHSSNLAVPNFTHLLSFIWSSFFFSTNKFVKKCIPLLEGLFGYVRGGRYGISWNLLSFPQALGMFQLQYILDGCLTFETADKKNILFKSDHLVTTWSLISAHILELNNPHQSSRCCNRKRKVFTF